MQQVAEVVERSQLDSWPQRMKEEAEKQMDKVDT